MNLLLDTHAFIWWLQDDSQLSERVRTLMRDAANHLYLSAVSGWEMAIKLQIGKLHFTDTLEDFIPQQPALSHGAGKLLWIFTSSHAN